ncbi:MAG: hypothetical protein M0Z99_19505 [Betaproteobacteria bacterium]|nr:hypothetical protein [Betaproteobacteria bacterium]
MKYLARIFLFIVRVFSTNKIIGTSLFFSFLFVIYLIIKYHIPTSVEGAEISVFASTGCAQTCQNDTTKALSDWERSITADPYQIPATPASALPPWTSKCVQQCQNRGVIGNFAHIRKGMKAVGNGK